MHRILGIYIRVRFDVGVAIHSNLNSVDYFMFMQITLIHFKFNDELFFLVNLYFKTDETYEDTQMNV